MKALGIGIALALAGLPAGAAVTAPRVGTAEPFADVLTVAREPVLSRSEAGRGYRQRIRLLVVPARDMPLIVRADQRTDGSWQVRTVSLEIDQVARPTAILLDQAIRPNRERIDWTLKSIADARLLDRVTDRSLNTGEFGERSPPSEVVVAADGVTYALEIRRGALYKRVTRHSSTIDWPVSAVVRSMLRVGGLPPVDPSPDL